ncbi:MAG: prepilin peptidase [Bradyrhizobiaceae bacterium PARB1]|nr:MAG: prepilin peptidase [Bradyrhizobiaceae bacterium PARB1]
MSDAFALSRASLPRPVFFVERSVRRETALDRGLTAAQARLLTPLARLRTRRLARIVPLVDAHLETLAALDDDALKARARDVRRALRGAAKPDIADIALSFALVREGARRIFGYRHFPVQLIGGYALLRGMIGEMGTGEGKTLTVTLAAITAAFEGAPVHILTVNDYLAERDVETLGPLYRFFGLTIGSVVQGMKPEERRAAYACDITYCTNKEVTFDYLRDVIALGARRSHLRFKVDSITRADEATQGVVLRGLHYAIVDEADSVLVDEARTPLILSQKAQVEEQADVYAQALELARGLERTRDYLVWEADRTIALTPDAVKRLKPLGGELGGPWRNPVHREELVTQALTALHLMLRDEHYIVRDGKVEIVDESTGRVMPDRFWTDGLHQMIELKEGCEMSGARVTLARMTYQRFFRRYNRLSGLSGTVREVGTELWCVYRLPIAQIPPNRPSKRKMLPAIVTADLDSKWRLIAAKAAELSAQGVPVLIGTRSVATSLTASEYLTAAELPHVVLNAAQDSTEADIIAVAGEAGKITVATNMAGRGTDIRLAEDARANGGLHVIMSEIHETKRIDRQLAGRAARQGDPGTFIPILSMHDPLIDSTLSPLERWIATNGYRLHGERFGRIAMRYAQRKAEKLHAQMRNSLLRSDEMQNTTLAFTGNPE